MSCGWAARILSFKSPVHIPLWRRSIPRYPLYWKGNPQLRILMPLFWMRPVKSKNETPPNYVQFEVHPQMTRMDIKNYLKKIYDIPVQYVSSALVKGEIVKDVEKGFVLRQEPDRRMAFVQLAQGGTFKWPELLSSSKKTEFEKMGDEHDKLKIQNMRTFQKQWSQDDVPSWFR